MCWVYRWVVVGCVLTAVALASNLVDNRLRKSKLVRKMKKFREEGDVRLIGSSDNNQGNVEIRHASRWGSICDDEWDLQEATVVCRQLGLGPPEAVTHGSRFGQPHGDYFMDNVWCTGEEAKLSECRFDGWNSHDCTPDEAAGVICQHVDTVGRTTPQPVELTQKYSLKEILGDNLKVRLQGGRVDTEGRVEINIANELVWSVICGEGWTLLQAQVICRSIGFGFAQMATQTAFFASEDKLRVGLSGVECRGNETSLRDCAVTTQVHTSCAPGAYAGVICTQYLADLVMDYKEVMRSAYLEDRPLYLLQCAMEENCLASGAYRTVENSHSWHLETRRLLRFTASILNAGNAEFRPALPKHLWEFHQCHMHYHSMEVFATFDVYAGNKKVAEGHKASFCLEDNRCQSGAEPNFACANYGDQGISVNCSDIYKHNIDCQWVDISEIEPGIYTLKIAINPEFKVAEMSFENNAAICQMYYGTSSVHISNCVLDRP